MGIRRNNKLNVDKSKVKKYSPGFYVYKYYISYIDSSGLNVVDELEYIGKTDNPVKRFHDHKDNPKENFRMHNISKIELASFPNYETMSHYERYLITKLKPSTNKTWRDNEPPAFELPEVEFEEADPLSFCRDEAEYQPFLDRRNYLIEVKNRKRFKEAVDSYKNSSIETDICDVIRRVSESLKQKIILSRII